MFYTIIFAVLAVVLVVAVLMLNARGKTADSGAPHHQAGTDSASHTASGSAQRKERKRRRAQSRSTRRRRR